MELKEIFDIATKPFDWRAMVPPIGLIVFGIAVVWMERAAWIEKYKIGKVLIKKIGYVLCFLGILTAFYLAVAWRVRKQEGLKALRTGNCSVVEGPVENFRPMPVAGHPPESFSVGNRRFEYSDYIFTACFNKTSLHSGPIRQGLTLRISYVDDCIIKIESADQTPSAGDGKSESRH